MIEGRVIPDWKKFISSGANKQSLIRFLGDYIVKHINQNSSLQEGQSLYLAGLFLAELQRSCSRLMFWRAGGRAYVSLSSLTR